MITLYGIKNCDTVKKARAWLEQHGVDHAFHDFREDGLDRGQLQGWLDELGWETLINRRSTTWRQFSDAEKQTAETDPMALLQAHPTLLKRPVITDGEAILDIGFSPYSLEDYIGS